MAGIKLRGNLEMRGCHLLLRHGGGGRQYLDGRLDGTSIGIGGSHNGPAAGTGPAAALPQQRGLALAGRPRSGRGGQTFTKLCNGIAETGGSWSTLTAPAAA